MAPPLVARWRLVASLVLLVALVAGCSCGVSIEGTASDEPTATTAGSAVDGSTPGTEGTVAPDGTDGTAGTSEPTEELTSPVPADTFEIATATGCELEVVAVKGTGPSGAPICSGTPPTTNQITVEPKANGSGRRTNLPDIPRVGYNSAGSRRTALGWAFTNPTYFKHPLTFLVVGHSGDWLKVLIPARPNHTEGWVRARDVTITTTQYRMQLSLSDFRLVVHNGSQVVADTKVVIGTPGTPTPTGRFYVNDKELQKNAYGSYGPWVLSTNGYSEAMDEFDKHLPVIGFHGTNLPGLIGTMSSNGCVRMANDVVIQLANALPLGTPIDITP